MSILATKLKYPSEAILAELRAQVQEGHFRDGATFPSELSLAKRYGVCRATVNKTLKQLEREGLLVGGRGRGRIVVSRPAPRRARTSVIEFVTSHPGYLQQPESLALLEAFQRRISQAGYHHKIVAINESWRPIDYSATREFMQVIDPARIDGCVLVSQLTPFETAIALAETVPVVWLHQPSIRPGLAGVRYKFHRGAFASARHLIGLGHRHIGLICIAEKYVTGLAQVAGTRLAVEELLPAGEGRLSVAVTGAYRAEDGEAAARELLSRNDRPTAIISGCDEFTPGIFKVLNEAGLSVPRDVSLISWNDNLRPDQMPVPLTAVRLDSAETGDVLAEQLLWQIEHPGELAPTREIQVELIVRDSTAAPAQVRNEPSA